MAEAYSVNSVWNELQNLLIFLLFLQVACTGQGHHEMYCVCYIWGGWIIVKVTTQMSHRLIHIYWSLTLTRSDTDEWLDNAYIVWDSGTVHKLVDHIKTTKCKASCKMQIHISNVFRPLCLSVSLSNSIHNIQGRGSHVTYPIMHLMLPVCSPDTNWWVWLHTAAYILPPQCIMGKVTWDPPPPEYYGIELERLTDRQIGMKTLPSHKLPMQAVIKKLKFKIYLFAENCHQETFFIFLKTWNQSVVGNVWNILKTPCVYIEVIWLLYGL